jgi:SAM-dependent methyltransferase
VIAEGTPAARFALEHAHYVEDIPFWRSVAADAAGPVLDLGAAVGRVAIPLARDGHAVWALDGSSDMLAALRDALGDEDDTVAARVHTVHADLRAFALDRTFPLAIMPMNTMQTLLTSEDQLACLRAVRDHLDPGGELVFDLVMPDLEAAAQAVGKVQQGVTWRDPATGATLAHSAWYEAVDPATGTVSFTTRVDETGPDGRTRAYLRPQTVHLFTPTEVWELAVDAGLEVLAVFGDFDGRPLEPGSEHQIYRCGAVA